MSCCVEICRRTRERCITRTWRTAERGQRRGRVRRRHYPCKRVYRQRLTFLDLSEELCQRRLRLSQQVVTDICSLLQEQLLPAGLGGHGLPVAVKVTTALHFFAPGSFQCATGDISTVCQSSARKCIRQVMDGLFARASNYIHFPRDDNSQNEWAVGFASLAGFPRVQDAIECTHVAIRGPPHEPGVFINQKGYHCFNVQLVCDHRKRFMQVCARFPGSCHVAFILCQCNIPGLFQTGDRPKGWLIRDKGYPLETWLMAPLRNHTNDAQQRYNQSHVTTRCAIEQAIGVLKMRSRCLDRSGGALRYSPARDSRIIVVRCVLYNIAQQRGLQVEKDEGARQSSSVGDNIEEEEEDEENEEEEYDDGAPIARPATHIAA
ncbi:putative nuclease HARBI1 [Heptranchias perlo]|uniref:putative nuclease HARBI1 n=1 Tax=Heptranchias perlo TaxID=212740 RepID=UPI00355A2B0A